MLQLIIYDMMDVRNNVRDANASIECKCVSLVIGVSTSKCVISIKFIKFIYGSLSLK